MSIFTFFDKKIGKTAGAIIGSVAERKQISSLPPETVEVKIKEPIYETKEIDKIP
ncbi:MAG: hypothetical protein RMJ51_06310 [Candidatus Calescibacterium sp.]|nr:hypothetical protein [Candidatus Calescibacterium sp.]MCX7971623.1 hypothetical protein [bacterium]MDW8195831.1 hypothetical protein [Candidatus Calescibacterium sp.]